MCRIKHFDFHFSPQGARIILSPQRRYLVARTRMPSIENSRARRRRLRRQRVSRAITHDNCLPWPPPPSQGNYVVASAAFAWITRRQEGADDQQARAASDESYAGRRRRCNRDISRTFHVEAIAFRELSFDDFSKESI